MKNPLGDIRHSLDQQHFDKAIEILSEEQATNKLTARQRIVYRILALATYSFVVLNVILVAYYRLFPRATYESTPNSLSSLIIPIVLGVLGLAIPLLVVMNFSLIRKAWRQARLIRKLNLQSLHAMSWKAQKKKRRFVRLFSPLIVLVGAYYIFISIFLVGQNIISMVVILLLVGAYLILTYLILLWKNKMDVMMDISDLKEVLVHYHDLAQKEQKNYVEVPYEKMAQIATVEVGQIARQRAAAIDGLSETVKIGYTARKSRTFQESAASIAAPERLAVEDRVEGLLIDSCPADAVPSEDLKTFVVNVPGTPYALTYSVDQSRCQIDLLGLQLPSKGRSDSLITMKE